MTFAAFDVKQIIALTERPSIRILVTLSLLTLVLTRLDHEKLADIMARFDPAVGVVMLVINVLLFALFALRWRLISTALSFRPPFKSMLSTVWLAAFMGQFGPTLVVSELTRFQRIRRYAETHQLISSQILDRISGQVALFAIALLIMPFYPFAGSDSALGWNATMFLTIAIICVTAVVVFYRYRKTILRRFDRQFKVLNPIKSSQHYGVSILIQSALVLNFVLAARGLGVAQHIGLLIIAVPLILAATTLLPFAVADWGTREAAALLVLSCQGLSPELIVSVSIVYGTLNLIATLPGGLVLLRLHPLSADKPT